MTDTEILDWIEANSIVKFSHQTNRFFGDHWRVVFGPKSEANRHKDFRSAVRYAKTLVDEESEASVEVLERRRENIAETWRQIFAQASKTTE